ncbi:alpha,alpha-trehalose phosphorylase [Caloramator quimbayensis]|uniref:Alpha,alpha-trehalose phosphorylase n=1 Tax=Caloramator quimbayensis TaxID=1147123 RepID=A0A1T4Y6Z8_9CLOT|nr:hypothetical protein [Caloramator quimbayensis]SKA97308.1 alpha,alpha-trehalose phosphorylase [Caloramator quimbayensis]
MNEVINNLVLDEWKIIEDKFIWGNNLKNETLFSIGNGYIGMRGNFEEGIYNKEFSIEGTYINGFYETHKINYGERAYAFPDTGQSMINIINSKAIKIFADDEELVVDNSKIIDYMRVLDFKEGTLKRTIIYETKKGKRLSLEFERLVSFTQKHLCIITEISQQNSSRIFIFTEIAFYCIILKKWYSTSSIGCKNSYNSPYPQKFK